MPFRIVGHVSDSKGNAIPDLTVQAFDKDLGFLVDPDDRLGTATTDQNGKFEIAYDESSFKEWFEGRADVYLIIRDRDGRVLYKTDVRREAKDVETFEIKIPEERRDIDATPPVDPYGETLSRLLSSFNRARGTVDLSEVSVEQLIANAGRAVSSWTYYTTEAAWKKIGYDGPQVPRYPRDNSHDHAIPWKK